MKKPDTGPEIKEAITLSNTFKERFDDFKEFEKLKLKNMRKKLHSRKIQKTKVQKIRNNMFQNIYSHYQTHKTKYLDKLADFDVNQETTKSQIYTQVKEIIDDYNLMRKDSYDKLVKKLVDDYDMFKKENYD